MTVKYNKDAPAYPNIHWDLYNIVWEKESLYSLFHEFNELLDELMVRAYAIIDLDECANDPILEQARSLANLKKRVDKLDIM